MGVPPVKGFASAADGQCHKEHDAYEDQGDEGDEEQGHGIQLLGV